jgi:acyl carrier protein
VTEIAKQVKAIICEQLDVDPEKVTESAAFVDDLGADSLAMVELVLAMEEGFEVTISDEQTERIRTVGDAILFVQQELEAARTDPRGASVRPSPTA